MTKMLKSMFKPKRLYLKQLKKYEYPRINIKYLYPDLDMFKSMVKPKEITYYIS